MATSTLRKIDGLNRISLPKTREAFIKDFDGTDLDALAGLQQAFEGLAEDSPEAYALWQAASRSSFEPADIIENLANSLYQDSKVTGIRGKEAPVEEVMESGMPTVETPQEKATLPDPPAAPDKPARKPSVSPSMRKYASTLGVDISTVTGTGKNGAITKTNIEQAARAAEKNAVEAASPASVAQSESANTARQSQAYQAERDAAMRAASAQPAEDDMSDLPVPGGMGVTQSDLDADPAEVIPGAMGLTRDDVRNYLGTGGMLGDPVDAASAPMTMETPMQPAAPTVPGAMSADDMIALIDSMTPYVDSGAAPGGGMPAAGSPQGVDLSELIGGGTAVPSTMNQYTPPSTPQYIPPTNVSTYDVTRPVEPMEPAPTPEVDAAPWSPITSRSDKFLEAMGLGGMAAGARYLTKPADFALRNSIPLTAAGAGAYGAAQYFGGDSNTPPPEVINDLEMQSEQALKNAERGFSTFGAPPKPQMQMPQERPRGRSL